MVRGFLAALSTFWKTNKKRNLALGIPWLNRQIVQKIEWIVGKDPSGTPDGLLNFGDEETDRRAGALGHSWASLSKLPPPGLSGWGVSGQSLSLIGHCFDLLSYCMVPLLWGRL